MKTAAGVLSDGKHLEKAQLATRAAGKLLKGPVSRADAGALGGPLAPRP